MRTGTKLFLGGLTKTTTTELLYATFAPFGVLLDAVVMERNGCPRGFGFVTFAEELAVKQVLAQTVLVDGREVDIKRAVPEEEMEHVPTKVFVGGLPQKVDRTILKQHFARYGDVRDCVVMMDRTTGRSRGFGFVRFSAPEAVEAVLSAPQVLEGQVVDCKRAQPAEMLPPPKKRGSRDEKQDRRVQAPQDPDPTQQWLELLAATGLPQLGAPFWSLPNPGLAFDPSWAWDPAWQAHSWDAAATAFAPAAPLDLFAFDLSNVASPEKAEKAAAAASVSASVLGDVSNKYLGTKPAKSPLGDRTNVLAEKSGFSPSMKAAMKDGASSAAALAFA